MKRLGMYSGKIYEMDYDTKRIEECCLAISDEQANNKAWIASQHKEHIGECSNCFGCPLSNKEPIFIQEVTQMYYKTEYNEEKREVPFRIECTNCGSHNVDVIAYEHWDLGIKCNSCGSWVSCGKYNETTYKGE